MFFEYLLSAGHCTLVLRLRVANHERSKTPRAFTLITAKTCLSFKKSVFILDKLKSTGRQKNKI